MFNLPSWLTDKTEIDALRKAAIAWFNHAAQWLNFAVNSQQISALTCNADILVLLAYQRDIERFDGESEVLFRKRVHYASVNAMDAGSTEGLTRILARFGVSVLSIKERSDDTDWDVVKIELTDSELSQNSALLDNIIKHYGRTCRRYRYDISASLQLHIACAEYGVGFYHDTAQI